MIVQRKYNPNSQYRRKQVAALIDSIDLEMLEFLKQKETYLQLLSEGLSLTLTNTRRRFRKLSSFGWIKVKQQGRLTVISITEKGKLRYSQIADDLRAPTKNKSARAMKPIAQKHEEVDSYY